ncbi:TetR/AcrR family transcriptional regulator [Mycolicibacterium confluentis]|uniref:TetR family transcriptional regulator n=1 Tax=Mycolicibacterium confluentis TaxID=28047 RepID=A0A7I7Y3F5_9MYCO|nr:TetR/AcrR family transcriptional regulator [Mycolicibacterium confluentis]MCV7318256.1 TetR/AcrR family transcriptional regulator [Mycolicibacterium confluentis]ORV29584.1 hypothetical protein AWB99_15345 [Mycolicibacterium confluentis]BBZ36168.1 TetR family transcriptional regulator [Mycolicibacterium confluentis]
MSETEIGRPSGDRRAPGRGELQRARLVGAVQELLCDHSLAELSVLQITRHAGVTRSAFYFYFESKYALLAAAMDQVWARFAAARPLLDGLDLTSAPSDLTRQITRDAVEIWHQHHGLLAAVVEARSSDAQIARQWSDLTTQTTGQICQVLNLLQSAGKVKPASEDLPGLVSALMGMTVWTLLERGATADASQREEVVDVISAVWLAAVWGVRW